MLKIFKMAIKVEPLSAFLGTKAPSKAVAIDFPEVGRRNRV
jgi:hypothetical protein